MGVEREAPALLLQFAREPVAGRVKRRMIPHLTPRQALDLHCELVLWTCARLTQAHLGAVELAVAGNPDHPLFRRCLELGAGAVRRQRGADLGERMHRAIGEALACYPRVILVGSDCPGLDRSYLAAALAALERVPVVLGPAEDGGYVLIGARQIRRELFEGICWGGDTVLSATRSRLQKLGWAWRELPALADVDRPGDLPAWEALRAAWRGAGP
jgi:rSAM/selenodomain-associated transferase 1